MSNHVKEVDLQERAIRKIQNLVESDPQLSLLTPSTAVGETIITPGLSLPQIMDKVFYGYSDREAVGCRDYDIKKSPEGKNTKFYKQSFKTITYAQLQRRIHAVANVWKNNSLHSVKPDERVCIFGFTSIDFTILDFATAYAHAITVPMQTGVSQLDVDEIFESIQPVTVAVTVNDLVSIAHSICEKTFIRSLVVFEYDERDDSNREALAEAQIILERSGSPTSLTSLQDLELLAGTSKWHYLKSHEDGAEHTVSIVHSSGSAGKPKAALVTERGMKFYWTSIVENAPPAIGVCMAPFSHLMGKGTLINVMKHGGTAYFTLAPDMSTLFDDIRIVRPTFLGFFPRIIEIIYQHYQNGVIRWMTENKVDEVLAQENMKREMGSTYLGDRLCFSIFGGSQISPKVKDFFADCFDVQLVDTYGSTEGGSVAVNGLIMSPPITEYRLRDVPELGYFMTDRPFPRGEFCFKSIQTISGYYNSPDATEKLFDEDGFVCTGDIVEEYKVNHIGIIDRRNDVLKLSQGEYVPVGALGPMFEGASDVIGQIYIYGNSQRSYLLAVVVPNKDILSSYLGNNPSDDEINTLIQKELHRAAKQEGVKSFAVPKRFIVESEPFSETNGLLSGLRKKLRPALSRKYDHRLEAIYESMEHANRQARLELMSERSSLTLLEKLVTLLEIDLNIKVVDTAFSYSFYELGGDSLGAVAFSVSIEEIFGVVIQADMILSPTGNLHKWTNYIQQVLSAEIDRPNFVSIHGKDANIINSADLHISKFFNAEILDVSNNLPETALQTRTVLLTGANGFLGRFVCLEWLEKLAAIDGKLICLIRAVDNTSARVRLDSIYAGLDPILESRFKELARDHLEVLVGEVSEVRLGLSEVDYQRLAQQVDRVVHVAALVNHRLSYANLFGANVVGTAEIIRFALTAVKKSIDFVSSAAIFGLLDTREVSNEASPLRNSIALSDDYASGYGASKWASEHLLQQVQKQCGISVNVFRGDMMLPHQLYTGQANTADMFIRLIYSIIHTGLAPYSFFPLNDDGTKVSSHYDGLPVDVVARCVVGVDNIQGEYRTYNIQNYHHDDGISLDTFVDFIEAAGYTVARITDYNEWFRAFESAHGQLGEDQQQESAFGILDAFAIPQSAMTMAMGCDRFKTLVDDTLSGTELPHLSKKYIEKCLKDMCVLGLIPKLVDK